MVPVFRRFPSSALPALLLFLHLPIPGHAGADTLLAPILALPLHGEAVECFWTWSKASDEPPKFRWQPVSGATSYRLKYGPDSTLDGPLAKTITDAADGHVISYEETWSEIPVLRLYWKVAAVGPDGRESWSETRAVQVMETSPTFSIPDGTSDHPLLSHPSLTNVPPNLSTSGNSLWGFRIQASKDSAFATHALDSSVWLGTITDIRLSVQLRLDPSTRYFFRARDSEKWRTSDTSTTEIYRSPWSKTVAFTTAPAPSSPPACIYPEDGAVDIGLAPQTSNSAFRWLANRGATTYSFRLAYDTSFTVGLVETQGLTYTLWKAPGKLDTMAHESKLLPGRTYYWAVKSKSQALETAWSPTRSFRTQAVPVSPVQDYPLPNETVLPRGLPLSWSTVPGATQYRVRLAPDSGRGPAEEVTVNQESWVFKLPRPGMVYGWSVWALAAEASGTPSPIRYFRVATDEVDAIIDGMIPLRKGREWMYSLYNKHYNFYKDNRLDGLEEGLIRLKIVDLVDRSDSLFFTVGTTETGSLAESGIREAYSRQSQVRFLLANTRQMTWAETSAAWVESSAEYFSRRNLLSGKLEPVLVDGKPAHRRVLINPNCCYDWDFQYVEGYGMIKNISEYRSWETVHYLNSKTLSHFDGVPLAPLDIQPPATRSIGNHPPSRPPAGMRAAGLPAYLDAIAGLQEASVHDLGGRLLHRSATGSGFRSWRAPKGVHILRIRAATGSWTRMLPP